MVDDNEDSVVVDGLVDDTARGHHAGDDRKVRYQPSDLAFVRPDYTDDYAIDERADNVLTNEFPRWRDEEEVAAAADWEAKAVRLPEHFSGEIKGCDHRPPIDCRLRDSHHVR